MSGQTLGAQDSTSTRCVLGTSSRALRMLTESGDIIRYVFLRSVGLSDSMLVDGGGCDLFSFVGDSEIWGLLKQQ